MFRKVICFYFFLQLKLVKCEPPVGPSVEYRAPISSYGTPNYAVNNQHDDHHDHNGEPKAYEFGYQVKDDYTGTNYNRQEASDGNQVKGEYRVQLPDGRIQIVTYYADWQTGFHADVKYEGEAHYPENHGINNQYGSPNYNNANSGYNHNPATSAVSIKDYSGPDTPYNAGDGHGYGNNYNNGYNYGNEYDSYSNSYGHGNNLRPNSVYGTA